MKYNIFFRSLFLLLITTFSICSCSSGYDYIEIDKSGQSDYYERDSNVVVIKENAIPSIGIKEEQDYISISDLDINLNNGDYLIIYPNDYFPNGLFIKIKDQMVDKNELVILKDKVDLCQVYNGFNYTGAIVESKNNTKATLHNSSLSGTLNIDDAIIDYAFTGGINILNSCISINESDASAWFEVRFSGKCKVSVSGIVMSDTIMFPLGNLFNTNVMIESQNSKYLLPISINLPVQIELNSKHNLLNGEIIEQDIDFTTFIGDNPVLFEQTKSYLLTDDTMGSDIEIKCLVDDMQQLGFCIGLEMDIFSDLNMLNANLEYGFNNNTIINEKPYGVYPELSTYKFIRLFGNYNSFWNMSNLENLKYFDKLLYTTTTDNKKIHPKWLSFDYSPQTHIVSATIDFNDLYILTTPVEYGFMIHKNEKMPSHTSSFIKMGELKPKEFTKNTKKHFLYDLDELGIQDGDYYLEPYVKSEFGITSTVFTKYYYSNNTQIPDIGDDWIVD